MRTVRTPPLHTFPALRCALLFMGGIMCGPFRLPVAVCSVAFLVGLLCLMRHSSRVSPGHLILSGLVFPSLIVAGLGALKISADDAGVPAIPDSLTLRPVTVAGDVVTPPGTHGGRISFLLHADACYDGVNVTPVGADLMVTAIVNDPEQISPRLAQGMMVALHGWLSLPGPPRNPGEANLAGYWAANGIAGSFLVHGTDALQVIDTTGGTWLTRGLITPVRSSILRCIDVTIGGEEGEFLKGLLIGERGGISRETMQAFVTAGVAHVLAVSGSNVAVVAIMLGFIAGLVRFPRVVRTALIAAGLLFYMELTGGQTPVVRATIMALTFLVGRAAQRRANAYNSLGLSAFLILLYDARQLYDAGFQLSFCAVFGIIHLYPRMNAWISGIHGGTWWHRATVTLLRLSAVSLAATLATLPVTAAWFGRLSLIGVLANIPVVPATGLSVVLGAAAVAGSVAGGWVASALGALNSLILQATLAVTRIAAAVPYASLDASGLHPSACLAFCAATGLVFHWRERGGARIFIPALLMSLNVIVFFPSDPGPSLGLLRVHFIDVGQGDAILVEFPGGRTMLIDAGPWSPSFDAGERTVLPYLRRRGIDRIDLLVVTHPHSDHLGGVPFLLGHLKVGTLVDSGQPVRSALYGSYLRASAADGVVPEAVSAGQVLDAEPDVRLYVLSPLTRFVDRDTSHAPPNLNNTSVVLKLQYGHVALLLAGDAEENAEDAMVRQYGSFLRSTLLKSGHHGSITSSSPTFLDAVRPSMVAVSVGRRNRFHHPSAVVLERFGSCGALVARTDVDGAVIVETDGSTLTRVRWR